MTLLLAGDEVLMHIIMYIYDCVFSLVTYTLLLMESFMLHLFLFSLKYPPVQFFLVYCHVIGNDCIFNY